MSELKVVAAMKGREEAWDLLAEPWLRQHRQELRFRGLPLDAELHAINVEMPRSYDVWMELKLKSMCARFALGG